MVLPISIQHVKSLFMSLLLTKTNEHLFILVAFMFSCNSHNYYQKDESNCKIKFSEIAAFLHKDLSSLNSIRCLIIEDRMFEDENVSWKAKIGFDSNSKKEICWFETSWNDTLHIKRITILSDLVYPEKNIGQVGNSLKEIRHLIDENNLNSAPDGYLLFHNKVVKNITYQMNISKNSPLTLGITSLNQVPDTLKVEAIILD